MEMFFLKNSCYLQQEVGGEIYKLFHIPYSANTELSRSLNTRTPTAVTIKVE